MNKVLFDLVFSFLVEWVLLIFEFDVWSTVILDYTLIWAIIESFVCSGLVYFYFGVVFSGYFYGYFSGESYTILLLGLNLLT